MTKISVQQRTSNRRQLRRKTWRSAIASVPVVLCLAAPWPAAADEADARQLLQAMSDYLAGLEELSFDFDSVHEVVTTEDEKLGLARSGTIAVARPNQIHATRVGGFASLEMTYDGAVFAILDSYRSKFAEVPLEGDLGGLVDELRDTYGRLLPAADLIVPNLFPVLMEDVTAVKDIGSGVIGGVECDHLAFRGLDVDWQVWIAQGDTPYPCQMTITARDVAQAPQYRVTLRGWSETAGDTAFTLVPPEAATTVDIETFAAGVSDYPEHFSLEEK